MKNGKKETVKTNNFFFFFLEIEQIKIIIIFIIERKYIYTSVNEIIKKIYIKQYNVNNNNNKK